MVEEYKRSNLQQRATVIFHSTEFPSYFFVSVTSSTTPSNALASIGITSAIAQFSCQPNRVHPCLLRRLVWLDEHLAEPKHQSQHIRTNLMFARMERKSQDSLFKPVLAPDLVNKQRHLDHVKLLVQLLNLLEVLFLHLPPRIALLAGVVLLGEQQLVDDDAVGVNLVTAQLLNHPLRLVQRQELGDAHADESGEVGVLELRVDLADGGAQVLHLLQHVVEVLAVGQAAARAQHRVEHRAELAGQLGDFGQRLFQHRGELQKAQRVARGRRVEDDGLVAERFDLLEHFGKGHCFVYTGDLEFAMSVCAMETCLLHNVGREDVGVR